MLYKIDNLTIVKLLGGVTLIFTTILSLFSRFFLNRINHYNQHSFDVKLENIKGEISKNNNLLNIVFQNHISSSQKIIDKKIQSYDFLWNQVLQIREDIPSGILLICQIFNDLEINSKIAFADIDNNTNLGPILRGYIINEKIKPFMNRIKPLLPFKPYLSNNAYKLFFAYNAAAGRITHEFIRNYQHHCIYNWKFDDHLLSILKIIILEDEIKYIYSLDTSSFTVLIDLIEQKILNNFKLNLNIEPSTEETLKYINDIKKIIENENYN